MLQEMNAQSQKVGNGGSQKEAYIVEPQERHWMSYSTYNGPPDVLNGQICVISTVLDAGAHTSFSGVRTLVVGEATGVLNKVRIQDWVGTPYHVQRYSHPSRSPRATVPPKPVKSSYQRSLAHHKHANERSSKLLKSNANIFPPLCTIILELADTSNKDWSSVSLALRYEGISNHNPLRVIYDHTVWFTPEQRSTISVLRLISEHSFNGFPKPTSTGLHLRPEGTPNHCIRILPLITHCSPPKLPSEVIQNIGYYVFEGADRNFRSLLLSFALLCKAWSPIVNIFWETLGTFSVNDKPDAKLVLQALSRQPEKARYVKRFIPWDYRILEGCNDKPYYHFSDIHLGILTMVTFVSEIHLCSIHLPIVESLLQLISTLPGIEIFIINDPISLSAADDPVAPPHGYYLNISDILDILPHWKKLRILHIEQCQATEPEQVTKKNLEAGIHPSHDCKIEELLLRDGDISGSQLLQFISPSRPTLLDVELDNLQGLSIRDLVSFFSQVSSTIEKIVLLNCAVSRDTEDDEYALDDVIQHMVSLKYAFVQGPNLASLFSVTRKTQGPPLLTMISIGFADDYQIDANSIIEALRVTAWHTIQLIHASFSQWGAEPRRIVADVARQRNIEIELLHPEPMLP